ncbi:membrane protein of unknown function [Methanocaldococcus lauensis]|uniref:Uncharacterized protein n=1 Tax=Methanocaldococcus lauensis TaxID=2546128 RepID=A0A8D6PVK2_9EURY|nr:hypothetical protein [Methanocaldococcus lauensis]CAB3288779.1 membrane protein of unknown function [Methanocaldococcus lauensis]
MINLTEHFAIYLFALIITYLLLIFPLKIPFKKKVITFLLSIVMSLLISMGIYLFVDRHLFYNAMICSFLIIMILTFTYSEYILLKKYNWKISETIMLNAEQYLIFVLFTAFELYMLLRYLHII